MLRYLILALIGLLALVMVIFGMQNTQPVTVRFLWLESGSVPLALVMIIAALAGAVLTGLIGLWDQVRHGFHQWRMGRQLAGVERRAASLEQQVATLTEEKARLLDQAPAGATTGTAEGTISQPPSQA